MLRLAAGLRANGVDADIDLYHAFDDVDWTRWGPQRVHEVDVVLVVVSQAWRDAWEGSGGLTRNIGAGAEADALRSISTANRAALVSKCRLLVLPGSESSQIPVGLHGIPRHVIGGFDDPGLHNLVRDLTRQPRHVKPPLGRVPVLPPGLTDLTPDIANIGTDGDDSVRTRKPKYKTAADVDREEAQLRAQLAALPEPLADEGPQLPWFRARNRVIHRLSEIEEYRRGRDDRVANQHRVSRPADFDPKDVDWQRLPSVAKISWRTVWDIVAGQSEACLAVHLRPLPLDLGLSERILEGLGNAMPGLVRNLAEIPDSDGLETAERYEYIAVAVSPVRSKWDDVRASGFRGCRVFRDGQVSIWYSLPADRMGAVIDQGQLKRDLRRLNRPGSDGGSQSMEDESHGGTEEVPRRVA